MPFDIGDKLKQVVPVIAGPVEDIMYDKVAKSFSYLLSYSGADGEHHQRWFAESEVESAEEGDAA